MSITESVTGIFGCDKPFAITMWDFSWLERRWPGAGYEDWDQALDELTERGYNAVRIDVYPHFMSLDPRKSWLLKPQWTTQTWGSASVNRVNVCDALRDFLHACRRHNVRVGLSTWFREDVDNVRMGICSPKALADIWIKTLDFVKNWGELDNILYVDLCNEFPHPSWAPFYRSKDEPINVDATCAYMRTAIDSLKQRYPNIPATFSFCCPFFAMEGDVSGLDFLEPHVWMTNISGFYEKVGYHFERFDDKGYTNMALRGEDLYRANKVYYDQCLIDEINKVADWSRRTGKPLVTTECWSVVDYKDWPLLNWDWILDLNRLGVETATATGRWAGMATSNFCGPQFVGMWREVAWHRELTKQIRNG